MSFRVDPEHLGLHRPADTYDVIDGDTSETIVASVTHQQAAFIASVLNGRTEADIKAKALRDFADAHRMPWVMFRREDGSPVSVGDLMREVADRLAGGGSDE